MPVAALLLLSCGAEPSPALAAAFGSDLQLVIADEDNGPPPGSPPPPLPPLVQDPQSAPPRENVPPGPPVIDRPPLPRPPPAPVGDVGSRALWGVGLLVGGGQDVITEAASAGSEPGPAVMSANSGFGGVGVYLRLGVQANDLWGIETEISAGTVFADSYVRGALTFDYSPSDTLSLVVGPLLRGDAVSVPCGCLSDVIVVTTSVGATARVDLHTSVTRSDSGRGALTTSLVGDFGATVGANGFCDGEESFAGSGPAWALYLAFGYMHY